MMQTMPKEAIPLLGDSYAICNNVKFAERIERLSKGTLVAVQVAPYDVLLVPTELWQQVLPDVLGIEREKIVALIMHRSE